MKNLLPTAENSQTGATTPATEVTTITQVTAFEAVKFLNQDVDCVLINDHPYVVFKSLVENIGLHWITAFTQVKKDEIMSQALVLTLIPNPKYQGQSVLCMPLKLIPGWLFSVNISRVSEEVKPILLTYRRDVYDVLFDHYFGKAKQVRENVLEMQRLESELKELKRIKASVSAQIRMKEAKIKSLNKNNYRQFTLELPAPEAEKGELAL